jgi:thiol-disulfide isomerase/thioredoxin
MLFRRLTACALFLLTLLHPQNTVVIAQTPGPGAYPVYIYLFWGEGCPHCAKAKPYFESLAKKYPQIIYRPYEVYYDEAGQKLFADMAAANGFEISGIPTALVGQYLMVGYAEDYQPQIEETIVHCIQNGCLNAGAGLVEDESPALPAPNQETATPEPTLTPAALAQNQPGLSSPAQPGSGGGLTQSHLLNLPVIGAVNLEQHSLTLSTALIALVDGFNPCSLWVLSMLIALVLHTGSRKKVLLIGLIFLTVTAGIYALFIAGLFSVLRLVSFMGWVQVLVAGVALVFGLVNIKDYFWYKTGVSFTISDKQKPGIFQQIRRIIASSDSIWGLAGATVVMAAGVSIVEFSCTAGFPVLWTNLLVAQDVSAGVFVALLLLYLIIYQIDELVIFGSMVITLKASRLEEKQGRVLKLFGGMLMLALAAVMLINPSLMNDLGTSAAIFVTAFSVAGVILIVHRSILPQLGIWIGSERREKRTREKAVQNPSQSDGEEK